MTQPPTPSAYNTTLAPTMILRPQVVARNFQTLSTRPTPQTSALNSSLLFAGAFLATFALSSGSSRGIAFLAVAAATYLMGCKNTKPNQAVANRESFAQVSSHYRRNLSFEAVPSTSQNSNSITLRGQLQNRYEEHDRDDTQNMNYYFRFIESLDPQQRVWLERGETPSGASNAQCAFSSTATNNLITPEEFESTHNNITSLRILSSAGSQPISPSSPDLLTAINLINIDAYNPGHRQIDFTFNAPAQGAVECYRLWVETRVVGSAGDHYQDERYVTGPSNTVTIFTDRNGNVFSERQ